MNVTMGINPQLDEYYDWFYGWGKVPVDTYKADIALLAWLHAELAWRLIHKDS